MSHHEVSETGPGAIRRFAGWWGFAFGIAFSVAIASPAAAQSANYTRIVTTGLLSAGSDEVSAQVARLFISNINNVPDPALPPLAASEESCTCVAQFLDGNGNTLQKQQLTLQPGENFSISIGMNQAVQGRVDISPGTASGFGGLIADQCVVSSEIMDASNDPVLFPPLNSTRVLGASSTCQSGCLADCSDICKRGTSDRASCLNICRQSCRLGC